MIFTNPNYYATFYAILALIAGFHGLFFSYKIRVLLQSDVLISQETYYAMITTHLLFITLWVTIPLLVYLTGHILPRPKSLVSGMLLPYINSISALFYISSYFVMLHCCFASVLQYGWSVDLPFTPGIIRDSLVICSLCLLGVHVVLELISILLIIYCLTCDVIRTAHVFISIIALWFLGLIPVLSCRIMRAARDHTYLENWSSENYESWSLIALVLIFTPWFVYQLSQSLQTNLTSTADLYDTIIINSRLFYAGDYVIYYGLPRLFKLYGSIVILYKDLFILLYTTWLLNKLTRLKGISSSRYYFDIDPGGKRGHSILTNKL